MVLGRALLYNTCIYASQITLYTTSMSLCNTYNIPHGLLERPPTRLPSRATSGRSHSERCLEELTIVSR